MIAVGTVLFALVLSLHFLLARMASDRLAKIAGERDRRRVVARMWTGLPD